VYYEIGFSILGDLSIILADVMGTYKFDTVLLFDICVRFLKKRYF
jgi:hypothetical protein